MPNGYHTIERMDHEHRRIKYENPAKENTSINPKTRFQLQSKIQTPMAKKKRVMNLEEPKTKTEQKKTHQSHNSETR